MLKLMENLINKANVKNKINYKKWKPGKLFHTKQQKIC